MMSEQRAKDLGLKPKVRVRAMAVAGVDPSGDGHRPSAGNQQGASAGPG